MMVEIILAAITGASVSAAAAAIIYAKQIGKFLQFQAIDERNQRMHEQRSLIARMHSAKMTLDPSAPDIPQIEDPMPYISDYSMDDDRFEAFMEQMHPRVEAGGPSPIVGDPEES